MDCELLTFLYNYAYKYSMKVLDLTRPLYNNAKCLPFDPSQAASSLVGGVLNLFSNKQNNKAAAKLAAQQNQWNIEQWNREADFTREMWNANNEYNDPSRQMERLTNAGLSPWAAASVLGAGDAQMVSTPSGQAAAGYRPEAANFDFIGEAASSAFRSYVEGKRLESDLQKADKENQLLDEQIAQQKIKTAVDTQFGLAIGQSQLNNLLYDEHNKKYNAALSMQALENNATMFQLSQDYQRRQNTMLERSITEQEIRNDMLEIQKKADELHLKNLPYKLAAELAIDRANAFAATQAGNLSIQQAKESFERTAKTKLESLGIEHANELAKSLGELEYNRRKREDESETWQHYWSYGNPVSRAWTWLGHQIGTLNPFKLKVGK